MKYSLKLDTLRRRGYHILRPQQRRHGSKLMWVTAVYTNGWSNYTGITRFETQAEAFSEIERLCAENEHCIDERKIDELWQSENFE